MVRHVHIDFETLSEVSLKTRGVWNYASDLSTRIICCAYAVDDAEPKLIVGKGFPNDGSYSTDWSELAALAAAPDTIFFAHNATFEMRLWEHQLAKYYGVPIVPIERWVCTMALVYMFNLPGSLAKAGEALNLTITKDKKGSQLITQLCSPTKITKTKHSNYIELFWDKHEDDPAKVPLHGDYDCGFYWDRDPEKFYEFYDYCKTDVKVERQITKMIPRLKPFERKIWEMDKRMNNHGMQIDLDLVDSAEAIFTEHKKRLKPVFVELTGVNPTQPAKVIAWLRDQGVEERHFVKYKMEKGVKVRKLSLDKSVIEKLEALDELTVDARRAVEIRKEFSKSSVAKYQAFKNLADHQGILRDYLSYGRAVTMRWGGNGAQPQNLPSRNLAKNQDLLIHLIKKRDYDLLQAFYPNISQALSSAIRGVIIAREGHEFIVSDYAAIEARVSVWLAGDTETCQKFADGADLYVDMARVIYGDRSITKENNPEERSIGKFAILGASYGMGHKKFKDTCESYGVNITLELAKRSIEAYRETYGKVKKAWYNLNDCAKKATQNPGVRIYAKTTGDKIYYVRQGSYLYCFLPSGRFISYPFPAVIEVEKDFGGGPTTQLSLTYMKEDSNQGNKWVRVDTYGGKLFENIVQSIARDMMAIGGINCVENGYQLLLMVHDEVITEVETGHGIIEECEELLADLPEWANGCPIVAAGGFRETRYRK